MAARSTWTDNRDASLIALGRTGTSWHDIAAELHCHWQTARERWGALLAALPDERRAELAAERRANANRPGAGPAVWAGVEVPDDVAADRDARSQLVPRSLTAALFGDPLPGCSALERRQFPLPPSSTTGESHASDY